MGPTTSVFLSHPCGPPGKPTSRMYTPPSVSLSPSLYRLKRSYCYANIIRSKNVIANGLQLMPTKLLVGYTIHYLIFILRYLLPFITLYVLMQVLLTTVYEIFYFWTCKCIKIINNTQPIKYKTSDMIIFRSCSTYLS